MMIHMFPWILCIAHCTLMILMFQNHGRYQSDCCTRSQPVHLRCRCKHSNFGKPSRSWSGSAFFWASYVTRFQWFLTLRTLFWFLWNTLELNFAIDYIDLASLDEMLHLVVGLKPDWVPIVLVNLAFLLKRIISARSASKATFFAGWTTMVAGKKKIDLAVVNFRLLRLRQCDLAFWGRMAGPWAKPKNGCVFPWQGNTSFN